SCILGVVAFLIAGGYYSTGQDAQAGQPKGDKDKAIVQGPRNDPTKDNSRPTDGNKPPHGNKTADGKKPADGSKPADGTKPKDHPPPPPPPLTPQEKLADTSKPLPEGVLAPDLIAVDGVKVTRFRVNPDRLVRTLVWADDAKSFYCLDQEDGTLRRI